MTDSDPDPARSRAIVRQAATLTKVSMSREWFTRDERGTWERMAAELTAKSAAKAAELGLSREAHDTETAHRLCYLAAEAQLADKRKHDHDPAPRRVRNSRRR